MWTTNGEQADWMCVLANTSDGPNPHMNKSLIIVPMKTEGITVMPRLKKLGMSCSDTVQTFFEDVIVPQKNRIGEEGMGFIYQMKQFQDERLVGSILGVYMSILYVCVCLCVDAGLKLAAYILFNRLCLKICPLPPSPTAPISNSFLHISAMTMVENLVQQTANYCSTRELFGKALLDNQVVHFRLAEILTEIELLRSLIYRAAGLK